MLTNLVQLCSGIPKESKSTAFLYNIHTESGHSTTRTVNIFEHSAFVCLVWVRTNSDYFRIPP
jgi:hypothetical protein